MQVFLNSKYQYITQSLCGWLNPRMRNYGQRATIKLQAVSTAQAVGVPNPCVIKGSTEAFKKKQKGYN